MDRTQQRRFDITVGVVVSISILAFTRIVPEAFDLTKAVVAIVFAPVLLFAGALRFRSKPFVSWQDPVRIVLVVASFAFVVSWLRNPNLALGFIGQEHRFTGLFFWLAGLLAAWIVYSRAAETTADRVLKVVFFASIAFIAYGAVQALGADPFEWTISSFGKNVVFSTQGNPNFASWTTVLVVGVAHHVLLSSVSNWGRASGALIAAGGMWISIETQSVQGLAGIAVLGLIHVLIGIFVRGSTHRMERLWTGLVIMFAPVFLFALSGSSWRNVLIALAVGTLLLVSTASRATVSDKVLRVSFYAGSALMVCGVALFRDRLIDELGQQSGERTAFYLAGWRMFESSPFIGVGLERYGRLFPFYRPSWHAERLENSLSGSAHSIWLAFAVWGGLLLLVPMLVFGFLSVSQGVKSIRSASANLGQVNLVALTGSLILCWLISAESASVIFVTLMFMGLCAVPVARKASKVSSSWRSVSIVLSGALLFVASFIGIRWMVGNKAQNDAYRELFGNQNIEEGLRLLDRGVAWSPVPAEILATRANVLSQLGVKDQAVSDALEFIEAYEYTGPGVLASARILIQFGETESARYVLEKGIERNPGSQSLQSQAVALLESLPPK
jgi:hypothetical protein